MSWNALLTGVVAGVVAATIWAVFVWRYRQYRFKSDYGHLAGEYQVLSKLSDEPESDRLTIRVEQNILRVTIDHMAVGVEACGEISMNEQLRSSGRGHYVHLLGDGQRAFGFWDIQIAGADILVHTTYARGDVAVVHGYLWRMSQTDTASL